MKTIKKIIQPLGLILLRSQKKTRIKIKSKTGFISSAILVKRKIIMPVSVMKSQKTSGGLGNLYIDN